MAGYTTNGLPTVSASDGTWPLDAAGLVAVDTGLAEGQNPQSVAVSMAQLTGALDATDGPYNTAYAATITIDGLNGQVQTVGTLTGAVTISWTNIVPGLTYRLKLVQDGSGSQVATLTGGSTTWKVSGSQSSTASYVDWLTFWFDGTTYWGIWNTHFA